VSEKRRPRRKFTAEQKAEAVRLVRETGSICQVARDLDLTASALRNWVRQAEIDAGTGPSGEFTSAEKEELRRLRRENRVGTPPRTSPGLMRAGVVVGWSVGCGCPSCSPGGGAKRSRRENSSRRTWQA
jgi:transposase